jgi:hypothetical protein
MDIRDRQELHDLARRVRENEVGKSVLDRLAELLRQCADFLSPSASAHRVEALPAPTPAVNEPASGEEGSDGDHVEAAGGPDQANQGETGSAEESQA